MERQRTKKEKVRLEMETVMNVFFLNVISHKMAQRAVVSCLGLLEAKKKAETHKLTTV